MEILCKNFPQDASLIPSTGQQQTALSVKKSRNSKVTTGPEGVSRIKDGRFAQTTRCVTELAGMWLSWIPPDSKDGLQLSRRIRDRYLQALKVLGKK